MLEEHSSFLWLVCKNNKTSKANLIALQKIKDIMTIYYFGS